MGFAFAQRAKQIRLSRALVLGASPPTPSHFLILSALGAPHTAGARSGRRRHRRGEHHETDICDSDRGRFALASGSAGAATTDDVKWVNQYAQDNKGGVADEVVLKYCTCMTIR
jgi:hypothetical protein